MLRRTLLLPSETGPLTVDVVRAPFGDIYTACGKYEIIYKERRLSVLMIIRTMLAVCLHITCNTNAGSKRQASFRIAIQTQG